MKLTFFLLLSLFTQSALAGKGKGKGASKSKMSIPFYEFTTYASGSQEVPPVESDTMAKLEMAVDAAFTEMAYDLQVFDGTDITQAHLHCGSAGGNGPVILFLFGFVDGGVSENNNGMNIGYTKSPRTSP